MKQNRLKSLAIAMISVIGTLVVTPGCLTSAAPPVEIKARGGSQVIIQLQCDQFTLHKNTHAFLTVTEDHPYGTRLVHNFTWSEQDPPHYPIGVMVPEVGMYTVNLGVGPTAPVETPEKSGVDLMLFLEYTNRRSVVSRWDIVITEDDSLPDGDNKPIVVELPKAEKVGLGLRLFDRAAVDDWHDTRTGFLDALGIPPEAPTAAEIPA
jgi:hypothetical protein